MRSHPARTTLLVLVAATFYMMLSGFECASTEMSSARLALKSKDYAKAEQALLKEVAARPQNSEAWLELARVYEETERPVDAANALAKAEQATTPPLTEQQKQDAYIRRLRLGYLAVQAGHDLYEQKKYSEAIRKFDTALLIEPDNAEVLYWQALANEAMGDTARGITLYRNYLTRLRPAVDRGLNAGLQLGMTPGEVTAKLGQPQEQAMDSNEAWQYFPSKELSVYYTDGVNDPKVNGWRIVTAADRPFLRRYATRILSSPIYTLGIDAYQAGLKANNDKQKIDQAIEYLQLVNRLDPDLANIGAILAEIYTTTGNTDRARRSFEEAIAASPNDPLSYTSYGNFLYNMKDYPGAIAQYRQAMKVSATTTPEHQRALFNLGASYKSWGADLQDSLRRALRKEPTTAQAETYRVKIRDARDAFEQYNRLTNNGDVAAIVELVNIYDVLEEKGKRTELVGTLEKMAPQQQSNADYWEAMGRLYTQLGDAAKAKAAFDKADALRR